MLAIGAVLLACLGLASVRAAASSGASASTGSSASADVSLTSQSVRVPRLFFGLSVEYNELADYEAEGPLFDRMMSIMRMQNGAPLLLRVGGRSADQTYWNTPTPARFHWLAEIQQPWLDQLAALVRRDHLNIEPALNLAVHSPTMAVKFAQALHRTLPAGTLAGFAIGNEPDLYKLQPLLENERIASTLRATPARWTHHYTPYTYRGDYSAYAKAILGVLPGTHLTAPDLTFPSVLWGGELIGLGRLAPRALSFHRYAGAFCHRIHFKHRPTIGSFLSNGYATGPAGGLVNDIALARAHHLVVRITEINSVTCRGQKGVANAFATALWAPDALFETLRAGVNGVNWHLRPHFPNSPFQLESGSVTPLPELYGLAMFARMIGPGARLQMVTVTQPQRLHLLKAWAVQSSAGLRMLLINKDAGSLDVRLHVPGNRTGEVSRLEAPAPTSLTGVTLAGQTIGTDARWHGTQVTEAVKPAGGVYTLKVPGYSAALVDFGR